MNLLHNWSQLVTYSYSPRFATAVTVLLDSIDYSATCFSAAHALDSR